MMNFMKFFTMKKVFLILGLACTIGMTSCGDENKEPGNVPLTDITIDRPSIRENVRTGAIEVTVKVSPVPANATDVDFKWESKDASVATAAPGANLGEGQVAVLSAGSTVVTVRSGQVSKDLPVAGFIGTVALVELRVTMPGEGENDPAVVLAVVDSVAKSAKGDGWEKSAKGETITTLVVGDNLQLTATPNPINANTETANAPLTFVWSSSDNNVATIDQTGKITVTGTGSAEITVATEGVTSDNNGEPAKKLTLKATITITVDE
jgi:uncharacterized protein YjdB